MHKQIQIRNTKNNLKVWQPNYLKTPKVELCVLAQIKKNNVGVKSFLIQQHVGKPTLNVGRTKRIDFIPYDMKTNDRFFFEIFLLSRTTINFHLMFEIILQREPGIQWKRGYF